MFGLIKNDCIATAITGEAEPIKMGVLIKIVDDDHENGCLFKIRDFLHWLKIYKTTIYKCEKDDFIPLTGELYMYLLALDSEEGRINFMEKVTSRQFDINMLKLGNTLRIRSPPDSKLKFFEFVVTYKGFVKVGKGCYIGLRLNIEYLPLPSHLIGLSQDYHFGGIGIVVPIDWILQNLHKDTECQQETANSIKNTVPCSFDLSIDEICSDLSLKPITRPKNINNMVALSERYQKQSEVTRVEINIIPTNHTAEIESLTNVNGSVKNVEKTKCDLCTKNVEIGRGVILRECLHSFCLQCIRDHVKRNSMFPMIRCPYCQIDLIDVEIKALGGHSVYSKIIDNRMKEYKATESNAKASLTGNWINMRNINEPGERQILNEMIKQNTNGILKIEPVEFTAICDKCNNSNIPKNKCITLQNCKHIICNDCIVPMTMSQTSKPQYFLCPICPKQPDSDEVSKIAGPEMLKIILDSRNNEPESGNFSELCFCRPTASDCGIVLKCKHTFCRTFLIETLKEQLQRISCAVCPLCCDEIDDFQKKCLVDLMKLAVVKKCRTCSNRADVLLAICQHPFCQKCIRDLITRQVLDPRQVTINCTTCHTSIADSDITQYASEKLLAQLKSKIETAPAVCLSKPFDHVKINIEYECVSCKRWISTKHSVVLGGCHHYFCLVCFMEFIGRQSNFQILTCPICPKLEQVKLDSILTKPVDMCNGSQILVECLLCEQEFQEGLIQKCLKCSNSVCLTCAKSNVLNKISESQSPNCPFCQISSDASEINLVENNTPMVKSTATAGADDLSPRPQSNLKIFEETDICSVCFEKCRQKIVLRNCGHEFCRQCLQMSATAQLRQSNDTVPRCPMCRQPFYKMPYVSKTSSD